MKTNLERFRVGEAYIVQLQDGSKACLGVISVNNTEIKHYTGKGLREMFPQDPTDEQIKVSRKLAVLSEDQLIRTGYISFTKLREII